MSTKILEAYKVDDSISMLELLKIIKNIKKEVVSYYQNFANQPKIIETFKKSLSPNSTQEERSLFKTIFFREVEESCMVYFHETGTYIQFFLSRQFAQHYENIKQFSDFHYQNQYDQPEDVSEENWENREKIWSEIYGADVIPDRAGLSFKFYSYSEFEYQLLINLSQPK